MLRLRFNVEKTNFCFCDVEIETTDCLFFDWLHSEAFWEDFLGLTINQNPSTCSSHKGQYRYSHERQIQ